MTKLTDDLKRSPPTHPKQKLTLIMPIPPSVNHMYFFKRIGKRTIQCLTADAKAWFNKQKRCVATQIKKQGWKIEEDDVWLIADFDFYMPDCRVRDTHNCFKITMDTLEGLVYKNDYFVKTRIHKVELDRDNPRVIITIYPEKYNVRNVQSAKSDKI